MTPDAVIIGAGACGLMCAVQAGFLGKKVIVLEKNAHPGAKILISGGGRCNYTNLYTTQANFISENADFTRSALAQWTVDDTVDFFAAYGITAAEKTLGQLFPATNKAADVVKVFTDLCRDLGQHVVCNADVTAVDKADNGYLVRYLVDGKERTVAAPAVVVASGGLPIKKMGATDFGLRIARKFGLAVTATAPALVPPTVTGNGAEWYAMLSGNSFFCRVWNSRASFDENVLFTHWGLSGPAVLQISSYWRPGEELFIDFSPQEDVVALVNEQRRSNGKKQLGSLLAQRFSRRFAEALEKYLPVNKNLADLTVGDIERLQSFVHRFRVVPAGDKGYDKAEVMRGGVSTAELASKTLEAKRAPGLYFGGECVDVTGWLGGYNFQWAWASGFVIAQHI